MKISAKILSWISTLLYSCCHTQVLPMQNGDCNSLNSSSNVLPQALQKCENLIRKHCLSSICTDKKSHVDKSGERGGHKPFLALVPLWRRTRSTWIWQHAYKSVLVQKDLISNIFCKITHLVYQNLKEAKPFLGTAAAPANKHYDPWPGCNWHTAHLWWGALAHWNEARSICQTSLTAWDCLYAYLSNTFQYNFQRHYHYHCQNRLLLLLLLTIYLTNYWNW
jgi:hypothetical protein